MKQLLCIFSLLMALARLALGQAGPLFVNDGVILSPPSLPPQIDATNFINNGSINIAFNNFTTTGTILRSAIFLNTALAPFQFSDVVNYTNRGSLTCDTGFDFNNLPASFGFPRRAGSFDNASVASITAGSINNAFTSLLVFFLGPAVILSAGVPAVSVDATNVVNSGLMEVGLNGLLTVNGDSLDLSRGTLHVEGITDFNNDFANSFLSFGGGNPIVSVFNDYWGADHQTNVLGAGEFFLPNPNGPGSLVTNDQGFAVVTGVSVPNAIATEVINVVIPGTNISHQIVFVNTNAGIATDIRFLPTGTDFDIPTIRWLAVITNSLGQPIQTNTLYLSDGFGTFTNLQLVNNFFTLSGVPQPAPFNYVFNNSLTSFDTFLPGGPYDVTTLFTAFPTTNDYAAYGVTVSPVTSRPDPTTPGSTILNTPGRITVNADQFLDLNHSVISGPNYLSLSSTNHFAGSGGAQIGSPFMDVNLGTTNGQLYITNLVSPFVPNFTGPIDMYSARWTNVVAGVTNTYHILMVDSGLSPTALPVVLNFSLRSTNVVISDTINVVSNLLINAESLTLTTNAPGAAGTNGQLNLTTPDITWSASFPVLKNLTNYGLITAVNTTYFTGVRVPPYSTTTFDEPYDTFVNHGSIITAGNVVWANYFEDSGSGLIVTNADSTATTNTSLLTSTTGPISIQAGLAVLTNGTLAAPSGDISISSGTLIVSNHILSASGSLTFSVTNQINPIPAYLVPNATNVNWTNYWYAGGGINLLIKPAAGDFLATTITNFTSATSRSPNAWAGRDFGPSNLGYHDNGAVGHLILNGGGANSLFLFSGPDHNTNYAIYVDLLELKNAATNRANVNGSEIFTALTVDANMTVYYADAVAGTIDISEKLNGSLGGRIQWVPSYAGIFSSTNIVYPSGRTNTFNRALVTSQTIDSNGNGIPNAFDPTPIFTVDNLNFSFSLTNKPPTAAVISWQALAFSTNYLVRKFDLTSPNWLIVTNFVQGPMTGPVKVIDPVQTNGAGFYQVQVDAAQP